MSLPDAEPMADITYGHINYERDHRSKQYDLPRLYTEKVQKTVKDTANKTPSEHPAFSMRTDTGAKGRGAYRSKAAQRVLSQIKERAKSQDRIQSEPEVASLNFRQVRHG